MTSSPAFPALPATWPYPMRPALPRLACRNRSSLPGLGVGWRLCLLGDARPDGPAAPLNSAFGRGGILRAGSFVLRPYRRGGLLRHVNARIYLSPVRFAAEFAVHRALWLAGFPTVEPVGYAWRERAWGAEGIYISRFTEAGPWPRHWDQSARALPALREAMGALCAWGLWAPDLNATNVLIQPEGILLLDWDRAQFQSAPVPFERYAARLRRSLIKLGAPVEIIAQATAPLHPG